MRYWDASALVPLVVAEPDSELVRMWLSEDDQIVTWAWSRTEITSAIERRAHDGSLSRHQRREALRRFEAFAESWDEVTELLAVRSRANALLARHPLRAADAGQLGAALALRGIRRRAAGRHRWKRLRTSWCSSLRSGQATSAGSSSPSTADRRRAEEASDAGRPDIPPVVDTRGVSLPKDIHAVRE